MSKETPKEGSKEVDKGIQILSVSKKLLERAQQEDVRTIIHSAVEKIDASPKIDKIRRFWDSMPHAAQWAIMHLHSPIPNVVIPTGIFQALVQIGVLKYKGAETDDELDEINKWNSLKIKWGMKIGAVFIPELRAVMPLLKPILEVKEAHDKILADARSHLREVQKRKKDAKEIAETRSKITGEAA